MIAGLAGGFTHTLHFRGPFQTEGTVGSQLVSVQLPDDRRFGCCGSILDDAGPKGAASRLRLWINGVEVDPPHTLHETIRHGGGGFSHWGKQVLFALPDRVQNDSATEVMVRYPYTFRMLMAAVPLATLLLALAAAAFALRSRMTSPPSLASVGGNLALAICALLTIGLMAARLGVAHVDQTFTGPFPAEQDSQLKIIDLRPLGALGCCLQAPSDRMGHGSASELRLWVNGKEIRAPHTPHAEIRKGHEGFSHWGNQIYFALPEGTNNSSQTKVRASFPLRPAAWTLVFPAMALALFIGLHRQRTIAWIRSRSASASLAIKTPYLVLFAIGWAVLAAGAAYLATVLWGLVTGEALAPAIPFRSDLGRTLVEALDPAIPLCLLILAAFGASWGWLVARSPYRNVLRGAEVSGIRWMGRYGLFCLVMFYLASVGATWAGIWRSGTTLSFLGLVPYFDAYGYFLDAHRFLQGEHWTEFSSRRPLAAALRTASFGISDFRFGVVLLWQVVAMAASTFFAAMTITRWRGLWAGVVFLALAYIAMRSHLATTMTEPLGLPIAFVALGFLAEAFRTSSKGHALLAVGLLSAAIWIRPGPMFAIPAFALWFGWSFHDTLPRKIKGFAIACAAIIAIIVIDKLLGVLFGSHSPGNLAYEVCGLSIGGGWSACMDTFPQEFAKVGGSPDAVIAWLYAKAFYNIQHDPSIFIHTILSEPIRFWAETPRWLLQGYSQTAVPRAFPSALWLLAVPVLGVLGLRKRNARVEAPFWILVFAGLTASAMFFYRSDGVRAMAVVYPLFGLFVAAVFSSPIALRIRCPRIVRREARLGAILTVAVTVGLFVFLPLERLIYPLPRLSLAAGESPSNTVIVGDFARSTGVLVVADDQPLPHGVPSVRFSRFAEMIRATGVELDQGILSPQTPKLPFGFTTMPRLDQSGSMSLLTPPEMMTRQDVRAWQVTFEVWDKKISGENWWHVVSATPYSKPAGK